MLVEHGKGRKGKKEKGAGESYAGTKTQTSTFYLCRALVLCLVL